MYAILVNFLAFFLEFILRSLGYVITVFEIDVLASYAAEFDYNNVTLSNWLRFLPLALIPGPAQDQVRGILRGEEGCEADQGQGRGGGRLVCGHPRARTVWLLACLGCSSSVVDRLGSLPCSFDAWRCRALEACCWDSSSGCHK